MSLLWLMAATPVTATPIARNFTGAAGGTTATASIVVTDPGVLGATEVAVLAFVCRQDRTITPPGGGATWQTLGPYTQGPANVAGFNLYVFWHRGDPASWTFTPSASTSGWAWALGTYTGVKTSGNPWHSTATATGTDGTIEVPGLTSLPANCMGVSIQCWADSDGAGNTPTGFGSNPGSWSTAGTGIKSSPEQSACHQASLLHTGDISTATWTLAGNTAANLNWGARILALEPA